MIFKFPKITDEELTNLINKEGSYCGAARVLGCNPETVRQHSKKRKLTVNIKKYTSNVGAASRLPPIEKLIELFNTHKSFVKIGNIFKCNEETIRSIFRKNNIDLGIRQTNIPDEKIFTNENELSYYLLGCYLSDGCVDNKFNRINIVSCDKDWMEDIKNAIGIPNCPLQEPKNSKAYVLRYSNKTIADWLKVNECVPKKSLICKMPIIPEKYHRDLIRGIFDGDGSISFTTKKSDKTGATILKSSRADICTASKTMADNLFELFKSHGLCPTIFVSKKAGSKSKLKNGRIITSTTDCFKVSFQGKKAVDFLNFIYYDNNLLKLNRKYIKYKEMKNFYLNLRHYSFHTGKSMTSLIDVDPVATITHLDKPIPNPILIGSP